MVARGRTVLRHICAASRHDRGNSMTDGSTTAPGGGIFGAESRHDRGNSMTDGSTTARRDETPTSVRARTPRDRRRRPEQCRIVRGRPVGSRIADLAEWAAGVRPTPGDEKLARRALVDTVAGTLAAADARDTGWTAGSPAVLRWAAVGHVLDVDDVHLPSSSRVSGG